jgi:hypothetical protein
MKTVGWDWDSFAKSYSEIQANVVLYFWAKALQKVALTPLPQGSMKFLKI